VDLSALELPPEAFRPVEQKTLGVSCKANRWRSVMPVLSWDALRGARTRQRIGSLPLPRQRASCRAPLTRVVADITVAGVHGHRNIAAALRRNATRVLPLLGIITSP
jgi:hypothetical protein